MTRPLHQRAFVASVGWTLILLFLGSVVHATESSLACPDWPTCHGTMVPEMSGGIFWEHLHRLVAGGLLLLWGLATILVWREDASPGIRRWCAAGLVLLLVQAVFGGLTVLYRLPDAVSTTHLGLALLFLALAAVLADLTTPERMEGAPRTASGSLHRFAASSAAAVVFAQSLLGGVVRHMDAGTACGVSGFLCLAYPGFPPASDPLALLHFVHRVVGVLTAGVVVAVAVPIARGAATRRPRTLAWGAAALVVAQVGVGFASAWSGLAVVPVSLHTVVAAALLAAMSVLAARSHRDAHAGRERVSRTAAVPA